MSNISSQFNYTTVQGQIVVKDINVSRFCL